MAASLAGALIYRHRTDIRALLSDVQGGSLIETNLYMVNVRKLKIPGEGRDGGIAPLGDGVLLANRLGRMWFVDPGLQLSELAVEVPINFAEFAEDPFNVNTNQRDRFAVKDLMVQELGDGRVRLLASFNYWYTDDDCYVLAVSALETSSADLRGGGPVPEGGWTRIFETTCLELTRNPDGVRLNPTLGAGGRLAPLSENQVLLTVGGMGPDNGSTPSNTLGKTVLLDLQGNQHEVFSYGHRDPPGLAVASDGTIWLTDHGARGGDELNRIEEGAHYGMPYVSYGTDYESFEWSRNLRQGRHDGYERPVFSWVPSIAPSQMVILEGDRFGHWQGDLIVSSLRARSLFRVRVEEERVIFVEPIEIGHRIRDIVETSDGTIVLKTEDDFLIYLTPVDTNALASADLDPETRGRLLASGCLGCHPVDPSAGHGLGPNLVNIVGRRVAAAEGYGYSEALRSLEGRWTAERLAGFIQNPTDFAPGTTMELASTYDAEDVADLVAYLRTLD